MDAELALGETVEDHERTGQLGLEKDDICVRQLAAIWLPA